MQRLSEDKCPLPLCLSWTAEGLDSHMFVLQENDTGEIIVSVCYFQGSYGSPNVL